jgi:predicted ester cyclase
VEAARHARRRLQGIAATGRRIALKGMVIYRVEGGKLVERWVVTDLHGVLEEMRVTT